MDNSEDENVPDKQHSVISTNKTVANDGGLKMIEEINDEDDNAVPGRRVRLKKHERAKMQFVRRYFIDQFLEVNRLRCSVAPLFPSMGDVRIWMVISILRGISYTGQTHHSTSANTKLTTSLTKY